MNLPVDFQQKIKSPPSATGGGYPTQLSAGDLMKNFVHAALDADVSLIEQTIGQGGHQGRKLKIPAVPSGAISTSLTAQGGALSWQEVGVPDGTAAGELLRWNSSTAKWEPFGRGTNAGQMIVWGSNGWQPAPAPPATGTAILGAVDGALQWIATEEC